MGTKSPENEIVVQIDDNVITLTGQKLEDFLQQKEKDLIETEAFVTQKANKVEARQALLQRLGISEEEAELLK